MKTIARLAALFVTMLVCVATVAAFEFNTVIVGGRPDGDPIGPI